MVVVTPLELTSERTVGRMLIVPTYMVAMKFEHFLVPDSPRYTRAQRYVSCLESEESMVLNFLVIMSE
jgi:hypothetical protein